MAAATTSRGARSPIGCTPAVTESPLRVDENRALAAQRLGDQRTPAAGVAVEQHGRMELDELDVADGHARPTAPARRRRRSSPRDWWSPSTGGRGRRWPGSPTARGRRPSPSSLRTSTPVTAPSSRQHLQRDVVAPDVQGGRGVVERALHLGAGGVAAGVDDPPPGVPALAGQRPPSRRRLVESRAVSRPVRRPRRSRRRRSTSPRRGRTARRRRRGCRRRAPRSSRRCRGTTTAMPPWA